MWAIAARAQSVIPTYEGAPPKLLPADAAVLESMETRADLPCSVKPTAPQLGFDLRFHAGYDVNIPLHELAGKGDVLTAIFRVTPDDPQGEPVIFVQRWNVPPIAGDVKGRGELHGTIALGPGKYRVQWLLRDLAQRVCATQWAVTVDPRGKDKQVDLESAKGLIQPDSIDEFAGEPPVERDAEHPLHVLVLLHAAPRSTSAVNLNGTETQALLAVLRRMAHEPRIGSYSVVAFNLDQATVLYQNDNLPQIDFPALGNALKQLKLGTVDAQKLREKDGEAGFLGRLLADEVSRTRPDALFFVGPRSSDPQSLGRSLKEIGEPQYPVFYINYTPETISLAWRDLIGSLVKQWKGYEYTISKPPDVPLAWKDIMSRLALKRPSVAGPNGISTIAVPVSNKPLRNPDKF
jgi:hypothetical protein